MTTPIRVLLVDADPLQREGQRLVLDSLPDVTVVAETASAAEALALLRRVVVDVAVVDVHAADGGGRLVAERVGEDAQIRLAQGHGRTRVLLIAALDVDRHGAGVLPKGLPPEALVAAVRG